MAVLGARRLLRAPWWVLSITAGVIFGAVQLIAHLGRGDSLGSSLTSAVFSGLVFGVVIGPLSARANRRRVEALGDLPRESERAAQKAVVRGPVPSDPSVRAAAVRLLDLRLTQMAQVRWAIAFWLLMLALDLWLVVTLGPWWGLFAVIFGGALAHQVWLPPHLRRRRALLTVQS